MFLLVKFFRRFLRKPNLSEASDQFSKLAKKVKTNEEPQYEGMCHLAIARCEQNIGNSHGEVEALMVKVTDQVDVAPLDDKSVLVCTAHLLVCLLTCICLPFPKLDL